MAIRTGRPATTSDGRERWLVPPRLLTRDEIGERHTSWLELFFDLVFVVAITQLSHQLVVDHSAAGFLRFAGLFVPVYVAWQGYMAYATRSTRTTSSSASRTSPPCSPSRPWPS
ncbi:MAG TPA: low temperature requirement protein A [Gaiellaceae bacterium]|jgi:low temperature requirement protein LtrA|nr:low temperature requirement protein A [Gaiellaceae bacterium]